MPNKHPDSCELMIVLEIFGLINVARERSHRVWLLVFVRKIIRKVLMFRWVSNCLDEQIGVVKTSLTYNPAI